MTGIPKVGTVGELKFVVEAKHTIDLAADNLPAVLSTPSLIWYLEQAALQSLHTWLEPGESSVGVEIDARHLAPTPIGHEVTCVARIIHVEGTRVTFHVEAHDEVEPIARGVHRRQVIRVEGFAKRVRQKTGTRGTI